MPIDLMQRLAKFKYKESFWVRLLRGYMQGYFQNTSTPRKMLTVRRNYKTNIYTLQSFVGHGARHYTVRTLSQMQFEQATLAIPAIG